MKKIVIHSDEESKHLRGVAFDNAIQFENEEMPTRKTGWGHGMVIEMYMMAEGSYELLLYHTKTSIVARINKTQQQ